MAPERLGNPCLDAAALQIELEPDPWKVVGAEGQCLVQGRQPRRDLPEICEGAPAHASAGGAVAHLAQVAGMREHERTVDEVEHVELEHVAAELDRELEGRERVLGRERGGTAMADARKLARRPAKLDQVRFTTTTAQSSASSPRANARQSSSTHCASSPAGRSRRSPSSRSRRASPYSSPSRRASITPSV